jgi:hypothetical protein
MAHILENKLSIDQDSSVTTGWPDGLRGLRDTRIEGRPIEVCFFDPRTVPVAVLRQWEGVGYNRISGLRMDPSWWGGTSVDAGVMAKKFSDQIETFQPKVVEYDVENKDVMWQIRFLLGTTLADGTRVKGLRGCGGDYPDPSRPETLGYRWGRPFVWTFEGRQTSATNAAHIAAAAGGKIGPQPYDGSMNEHWDLWWEIKTWVLSGLVPLKSFLPYYDADAKHRPGGVSEAVLFATSRCTELLA